MSRTQRITNYLVLKKFDNINYYLCGQFHYFVGKHPYSFSSLKCSKKNCVRICSMYFSEFTGSHYSCYTVFNSNGIEWYYMYCTGCWPLSIVMNICMPAEVKQRLACQVTGQYFDFINAQCKKPYSENSLQFCTSVHLHGVK